jgi:hypothetical protein
MAMATWLFWRRYRAFCWFIMGLAFFNIVASQGRMGYLTIGFALCIFYGVWAYIYKEFFKPTVYLLLGVSLISTGIFVLYMQGNLFVIRAASRWLTLIEQIEAGGDRIEHINMALSAPTSVYDYIFGVSRATQTDRELLVEVEPVNIFLIYGAIGFLLQYLLIAMLLWYFFRHLRYVRQQPALLTLVVASFIGLLSYQFFSLAYFFFREILIGLFPWILVGTTIGAIEHYKRHTHPYTHPWARRHLLRATPGMVSQGLT